MSLRTRVLLYIAGVLAVLITLVIFAATVILNDSVARIERVEMRRDLERLQLVRADALASLEGVAKDYAAWDDAYEFIASGDQQFIASNLQDQTFRNLRVNVILYVNPSGQIVFGKAFDLERNAPAPLAPELTRAFGPTSRLLRSGKMGEGLSGLLLLPDAPLLLSAQPILPSDGRGNSRGTLVMGRLQTESVLAHIGASAQLDVQLHRLDRPLGAEAAAAKAAFDSGSAEVIQPLDDATLAGFQVLPDLLGRPAVLLQATTGRAANLLGRNALLWFVTAFVLVAFAATLIVSYGVERAAVAPLLRLSREVSRVGASGDSSRRLPAVKGRDEVARLAGSINETLAALQHSRAELEASETRYRRLVETARDVIYTLHHDAQGQIRLTSIYGAFEPNTGIPRDQWLDHPLDVILHPDDVPLATEMYHRTLQGEVPPPFEVRVPRAGGGYVVSEVICAPLRENGRIVGQQGAIRDISTRKRLEAQLQAVAFASEQFLRVPDWKQAIDAVLEQLGTASAVSRVYLFEEHDLPDGGRAMSQRREWTAPAIASQLDNPRLQNIAPGGIWLRWNKTLRAGEPIFGVVADFPESERAFLAEQGIKSLMTMPIIAAGRYWGYIGLDDCVMERAWSATERETLRAAANAIGAAIQRGEAEAARMRARRHISLLNEVTRAALQAHDVRAVGQLLADGLGAFISADACYMTLWDERTQTIIPMATNDPHSGLYRRALPRPGERTLTQAVLDERRAIAIEDVANTPYLSPRIAAQFPARSLLGLPLIAGEQRLGAALLAFHSARTFQQEELALGEQVAEHFSLLLARARLLEEANKRARELSALHETALDITAQQELPSMLEIIVKRAADLLGATGGGLYLADPVQRTVRCVVSLNTARDFRGVVLRYGEGAAGAVALTGKPLVINDYRAWEGRAPVYERDQPFDHVVSAPLAWRGEVTGVIHVLGNDREYTQDDVDLLTLFAEQASIAVENARLFGEVQRLAITDDVTGIYNRRYLIAAVEREVIRARRFEHNLSLLMLDLDHFKAVNDRHGHQTGDLALRGFAERVRANIREIDLVARYGGEEFAVIIPEADQEAGRLAAERLRLCIAGSPILAGGIPTEVTASIGVATLNPDDRDGAALIARADAALYEAKNGGRNRVVVA